MPKVSLEYKQHQRERIIEGAAQAFAEQGYRQITIDVIAERLGVSKGAIYLYFKSKEELFVAIYTNQMERQLQSIRESYQPADRVMLKLEKVLDEFIKLLLNHDFVFCRLWLEFYLEAPRIPELLIQSTWANEQYYNIIYGLLAEGQRNGEIKADLDIASVTTVILATGNGLLLNAITADRSGEPQAIRQAMWNTFYNLLKA